MAKKKKSSKADRGIVKPRCGLCGKSKNLTQTSCCGQWICNDASNYVLFSYARNSCYRNHSRYTLCAYHHNESHSGSWKSCQKCKKGIETEMYVYYGTNEYNFEKLENPPEYEPTRCSKCSRVIVLGEDACMRSGGEYWCETCATIKMGKIF